ncbi:MAG: hypothetical protein AUF65_01295 [Chloroflexi bacterium 13_1_20CM_50_12]|nr:MAG: hypothetical protein AUF65_01295 [Chloroflexi bacterium 13_1_20CM_50_12]
MAKIMNDEQRLAILEAYDPQEHLIAVGRNKDNSPVLYYPAAWRLYELRLRYPHFTLEAEILHMDEEKGTVIIKAIGYDGLDYESSNLKGTAMKQGRIMELDKVETKAKSRVARDVGIGTEYALDMSEDETDARHDDKPVQQERRPKPLPQPTNDGSPTEQQMSTIAKLQKQLGEPQSNLDGLSFEDCAALLREYSQRLQEKRKSA